MLSLEGFSEVLLPIGLSSRLPDEVTTKRRFVLKQAEKWTKTS